MVGMISCNIPPIRRRLRRIQVGVRRIRTTRIYITTRSMKVRKVNIDGILVLMAPVLLVEALLVLVLLILQFYQKTH